MSATGSGQPPAAVFRIGNVKQVLAVLQAVRLRSGQKQQYCTVTLGSDGLSLRWEEESKALQSSVFLRPNVFTEFRCPEPRRVVGLNLGALMDTLGVFASSAAPLQVSYPGDNAEVLMEMRETFGGVEMSSYARVGSLETGALRDLGDYWEEPSSFFLAAGQLLKEVVDDMEWSGGLVAVEVQRDPPGIRLASSGSPSGNGALTVWLPVEELPGFHCSSSSLRFVYPLKRLQTAFTNLPATKDPAGISTKVTLDSNGIMKVAHMVHMQGGGGGSGVSAPHSSSAPSPSQGGGGGPVGIVQFMLLPAAAEDEEDAHF